MVVEAWSGTIGKQSYSYLIKSNNTVSFTWGFQRTVAFSMVSLTRHLSLPVLFLLFYC